MVSTTIIVAALCLLPVDGQTMRAAPIRERQQSTASFGGCEFNDFPGTFLAGCVADDNCKAYPSEEQAANLCASMGEGCGGLIETNGHWELRQGQEPLPSEPSERSHVMVCKAAHVVVGNVVCAKFAFEANNEGNPEIAEGACGTVTLFNEDGTAFIDFSGVGKLWVWKSNFFKLRDMDAQATPTRLGNQGIVALERTATQKYVINGDSPKCIGCSEDSWDLTNLLLGSVVLLGGAAALARYTERGQAFAKQMANTKQGQWAVSKLPLVEQAQAALAAMQPPKPAADLHLLGRDDELDL